MVKNFALVYVELAFDRADDAARLAVVSQLFRGVGAASSTHKAMVLRLGVKALEPHADSTAASRLLGPDWATTPDTVRERYPFTDAATSDGSAFWRFALDVMLSTPHMPPAAPAPTMGLAGSAAVAMPPLSAAVAAAAAQASGPSPGLSPAAAANVDGKAPANSAVLQRRKLALLNLSAAAEVSPRTCMMIYLAAASDTILTPVASRGEELLRRRIAVDTIRPAVDLEDAGVIAELIAAFLGDDPASLAGPQNVRSPASTSLRIRILATLCRSMAAACVGARALEVLTAALGITATGAAVPMATEPAAIPALPPPPPKLRASGMEFAVWTLRHAPADVLAPLAPDVLQALYVMLDEAPGGDTLTLRSFAYSAMGQLANRMPALVAASGDAATRVLTALASEPSGVRASAAEASAALCSAYASSASQPVKASLKPLLRDGLAHSAQQQVPDSVRAASIRLLNALFPFADAECRALCIAAAGDAKLEVREEAQRGLRPRTKADMFPSLDDVLAALQAAYPRLAAASRALAAHTGADNAGGGSMQSLLLPPHGVSAGITFLRACRAFHSTDGGAAKAELAPPTYRAFCEMALVREAPPEVWLAALSALREDASAAPEAACALYAGRISWLRSIAATHTQADVRRCVAQMIAAAARGLAPDACASLVSSLSAVVSSGTGASAASVPGAVSSGRLTFEEVDASTATLGFVLAAITEIQSQDGCLASGVHALLRTLRAAAGKDVPLAGTAASALGHAGLLQPLPLPDGAASEPLQQVAAEEQPVTKSMVVAALSDLLKSAKDAHVQGQAARALGHLVAGDPGSSAVNAPSVEALLGCTELAAKAEALMFAIGDALSAAFGGVRPDGVRAELMGDGTSDATLGMSARGEDSAGGDEDDAMDEDGEATAALAKVDDPPGRVAMQTVILDKLLTVLAVSTRPGDRCCAAAWLLALVVRTQPPAVTEGVSARPGRGALHPSLAPKVPDMQRAFTALLGDSSDVTQDLASQGLSAMHAAGDASTRQQLVAALVGTLTGDPVVSAASRSAIKVDADTQVFEKGALGTDAPTAGKSSSAAGGSGTSSSLSTYKELCSLATEMGQPDLIYRFMELANTAKAMSAKRGAAFGVARLAGGSAARKALAPHMATLVPRLFRMRHDPSPGVQEAAHAIWDGVVAPAHKASAAGGGPLGAVDAHLSTILRECTAELGSRLWRSREAACGALAEALSGRRWSDVAPHLNSMWTMALRALDDIKDSVRQSATSLARALASLSVRLCTATGDESSEARAAAMAATVPVLLSAGVPSPAAEVRGLAVRTLCQLAEKGAPEAMLPHVGDVVTVLLESLSSLEDQRISYLAQHAPAIGVDSQSLDAARVAASQGGALGDALERCIKHCASPEALAVVVPRLAALARSGTGVATRTGTARFVTSLCTRGVPGGIGPAHSSALLSAFATAVRTENNAGVRGAYASAAAAACRNAPSSKVASVVADALAPLAHDAEADPGAMLRGGILVRALARDAPVALSPLLGDILPAAFVAKHSAPDAAIVRKDTPSTDSSTPAGPPPDVIAVAASVWADVWDATTGAERTTLRVYAGDIAARCVAQLNASAWSRKRAGAAAAGALARGLGSPTPGSGYADGAFAPVAPGLATALLAALPGRIWDGKAEVFSALAAVVEAAPEALSAQAQAMITAAMAGAGRRARPFRCAALECASRILKAWPQYDAWAVMAPVLLPGVTQAPTTSAADEKAAAGEGDDTLIPPPPARESLSTLTSSWTSAAPATREAQAPVFADAIAIALGMDRDWRVRMAAAEAARAMCAGLAAQTASDVAAKLVPPLTANLSDPTAAALRTAVIEALGAVLPHVMATPAAEQAMTALHAAAGGDVNSGVRGTAARVEASLRGNAAMEH